MILKSKKVNRELIKILNEHKQDVDFNLSQEEIENNIIEWTTFYRRNLDIFNNDFLEIPTHLFQNHMILTMQESDISDIVCSRGASKSFTTGIVALDYALLYSNCSVLITSFTLNQSNSIIENKIDKELSNPKNGISPVLRQLRIDGYMEIKKDTNTGAKYVEFGNGSKIFAVNCGDSARGNRTFVTITDECVLIKKKDYQEIIEPTLSQRQFLGRPLDYKEEPKQIFLTSAKTKTNWFWKHLVKVVQGHYTDKQTKYGFFCVDIFTAVASGIQSVAQYLQRKKNTDEISFEQEYLNIFLGSNENSFFKVEDFDQYQNIEQAFYPTTVDEYISKYKFKDNEIRIISCDIAVATGNENDNTVFEFIAVDKKTGIRKIESVVTKNGLNSVKQAILIKRWFYDYKASYFIMDTKGVGQGIYDLLTTETYDNERGITYSAWTVSSDRKLQISSDTVIQDKKDRCLSDNAEEIIIPFAGTAELNTQIHTTLRKDLRDGKLLFLKDDSEYKAFIEDKDKYFVLKSSEEKAWIMLPYVQTRYLIHEAVSLNTIFTENGNIKLHEASRTDTKDRYMALAMGNLLADKIYNKYNYHNDDDDFNINDWTFLSN